MTECQLVNQEPAEREIYYKLDTKILKETDNWLEQFRNIWESRFDQPDKVLSTIKIQKE